MERSCICAGECLHLVDFFSPIYHRQANVHNMIIVRVHTIIPLHPYNKQAELLTRGTAEPHYPSFSFNQSVIVCLLSCFHLLFLPQFPALHCKCQSISNQSTFLWEAICQSELSVTSQSNHISPPFLLFSHLPFPQKGWGDLMDCEVGMFQQLDCGCSYCTQNECRQCLPHYTHIDQLWFIADLLQITAVSLAQPS